MREAAKKAVQQYIRGELLNTRAKLGLSRVEMGYKMGMSEWGYKNLETGKHCSSLISMLLFVNHCCLDPDAFWEGMRRAVESAEPGNEDGKSS